jgi:hypothetical protein
VRVIVIGGLPDTMRRIPYPGRLNGVLDNLVTSRQLQIAREDGQNELVGPAQFPVTVNDWQATIRFGLELPAHLGIPIEDQVHFVGLLSDVLSACEERRFGLGGRPPPTVALHDGTLEIKSIASARRLLRL